jgi:flavin-dependent dehydrogenase
VLATEGLTAAASLAQKGMKVLMLERHNVPEDVPPVLSRGGLNLRWLCTN